MRSLSRWTAWSAADLAKAQALIAASGTRGTPITIWSAPGPFTDFTSAGRYLASLLDRLGYPTHIRSFNGSNATSNWFVLVSNPRIKAQAYLSVLIPNYPAASEFLGPEYNSCQSSLPTTQSNVPALKFCNKQFDNTVRRALAAESARSPTAATCGRKPTGSSPIRRRWCPSSPQPSLTSSPAASVTTNTTRSSRADRPTLGALVPH